MKKLIFLVSTFLTLNCWADWSAVSENTSNSTYYLDIQKIKQTKSYTYLWYLVDYIEPINVHPEYFAEDVMSETQYLKVNCNKLMLIDCKSKSSKLSVIKRWYFKVK